jgi:hypothetical protein
MIARGAAPRLARVGSQVTEDLTPAPWADVIRDGTLQSLAAVRTLLAAGLRQDAPGALERAASDALREVDRQIGALRERLGDARSPGAS